EPEDERSLRCRVAGPTALLIAKSFKLHERLAEGGTSRVSAKDASDVYLLMRSTSTAEVIQMRERLAATDRVAEPSALGFARLSELFGARRSAGVQLAAQALAGVVPEERIQAVCNGFVARLRD